MRIKIALLLLMGMPLCFLSGGSRVRPAGEAQVAALAPAAVQTTAPVLHCLCPACARAANAAAENCLAFCIRWEYGVCEHCGSFFGTSFPDKLQTESPPI